MDPMNEGGNLPISEEKAPGIIEMFTKITFLQTLKNRVTYVEKKSKTKSESIEPHLPGVGVDPGEDGGEDEQEDVDDKGRVDSRLRAKSVSK